MSVSGGLDAKWAIEQKVYCGTLCQVQGSTNIIGVGSVATFTLAITVHTWWVVHQNGAVRYNPYRWIPISLAIWLYFILFVVVGYIVKNSQGKSFFAPSPLWCFIAREFTVERILGQYLWIWTAGIGNIVFYTQLFLCARGNLSFDSSRCWPMSMKWHCPPQPLPEVRRGQDGKPIDEDVRQLEQVKKQRELAYTILWYPASYTLLTIGLSVTRWANISENIHLPEHSSAAAGTIFSRFLMRLSGLVTVILLFTTRHNMLLLGNERGVLLQNDPRRGRY
ncbi:hypothetical protein RSOLAG1IB_01956 [Rhizoctonia solani AG-1 IB]|uniref:Glucose receptor Git3 N-terminal domain-containing protein n=1 Tax=Thanatephorus cucumeris (strain AG1-IB / isolate 7/3/14) TaxID=1108050 RepID=A0A0B7FI87_THACB|nr:hypothetical protein RSOLAG1IB_01956 [Rhizoctonia solani AG-1 IB]